MHVTESGGDGYDWSAGLLCERESQDLHSITAGVIEIEKNDIVAPRLQSRLEGRHVVNAFDIA